VPKDAERIGILIGNYRNEQKALLTAKNFAAQAGGEAILIVSATDPNTGEKVASTALLIAGLPGAGAFKGKYYYLVYRLPGYSLYDE